MTTNSDSKPYTGAVIASCMSMEIYWFTGCMYKDLP